MGSKIKAIYNGFSYKIKIKPAAIIHICYSDEAS